MRRLGPRTNCTLGIMVPRSMRTPTMFQKLESRMTAILEHAKEALIRPTIAAAETRPSAPVIPKPPKTFADAGLDIGTVESLILKHLLGVGSSVGSRIAETLCLPTQPVIECLSNLKSQQVVVYVGTAHLDDF